MATKMLGKDLRILLDTSIVGYASDFTYTISNKLLESTELESGEWESYLNYGKGFKASANAFLCRTAGDSSRGYNYMLTNIMTTNASLAFECKAPDIAGNQTVKGCVFTDSLQLNSNNKGEFSTWTASFTGTGTFTIGTT